MAQALSEQIFLWQPATVWPPKTAATNNATTSYQIEGTILKHFPLNVRQATVQQGYLKSTVSADVNFKFRALEVNIVSIKDAKTGASIPLTDLSKLFKEFIQLASNSTGSSPHLLPTGGSTPTAVFWSDATLQTDLSSKVNGKPVELTYAFVKIQTDGATLMTRSVEILQEAAQNKLAPKLEDQPNLFAQAQGKFNPAAAAAIAKPKPTAKDEDEWED